MDYDEILNLLHSMAEPEYQKFTAALIPNVDPKTILGVRITNLRNIAKKISRGDWRGYLSAASNDCFEEIMLQGMVIGYAKADIAEILKYTEKFIPEINNWSVCDSFCTTLKITKKYQDEMWAFVTPYLKDDREFFVRFGVIMLLDYFVDEKHANEAFRLMDDIKCDGYYVKMAVAWAVSVYFVKLPKLTMKYLKNNRLDDFTYNKALQKITESYRVSDETKSLIRSIKRKKQA